MRGIRSVGKNAADDTDQQVAGEVAGDGLRAVRAHGADAVTSALVTHEIESTIDDLRSFEHHQHGQHEDRHHAGDTRCDAAQDAGGGGGQPTGHRADLRLIVLYVLNGVGTFEKTADGTSAGPCVGNHLRELVGEGRPLSGERHGEGRE
jgi:hypothetical protein